MSSSARVDAIPLPHSAEVKPALQDGKRSDGRDYEEFRALLMQTKSVSQAAGSAYVEVGDTKVMAAVYGPKESERKFGYQDNGKMHCEVRLTTFTGASNLKGGQVSSWDKDLSGLLLNSLTPSVKLQTFPNSSIDVHVMPLSSGGSDAAAVIVAASLALADAGIQTHDLVPACCVGLVGGNLLLDPSLSEIRQLEGTLLLACMPSSNQVTQLAMTGTWSNQQWREGLELAMAGCAQLRESMNEALGHVVESS